MYEKLFNRLGFFHADNRGSNPLGDATFDHNGIHPAPPEVPGNITLGPARTFGAFFLIYLKVYEKMLGAVRNTKYLRIEQLFEIYP